MTFNFTEQETNYIVMALGKRPMEEVEALINKIRFQATSQLEPKPEKVDEAKAV